MNTYEKHKLIDMGAIMSTITRCCYYCYCVEIDLPYFFDRLEKDIMHDDHSNQINTSHTEITPLILTTSTDHLQSTNTSTNISTNTSTPDWLDISNIAIDDEYIYEDENNKISRQMSEINRIDKTNEI